MGFKLGDEESVARHINDRRVRFEQDEDETPKTQEVLEEISEHDVESLGDEIESINVLDDENELQNDETNSDSENNNPDVPQFPDTELEIKYSLGKQGKVVELKTTSTSQGIEAAK